MTVEIDSDRDKENREQMMKEGDSVRSEKADQEMVEDEGGWNLEDEDGYTNDGTSEGSETEVGEVNHIIEASR